MQFLNAEGQLVEGFPLTPEQVRQHALMRDLIHEKVCGHSYHSDYDRRYHGVQCEKIAHYLITTFTFTPIEGTTLEFEVAKAQTENAPHAIEAPTTPVVAIADDPAF